MPWPRSLPALNSPIPIGPRLIGWRCAPRSPIRSPGNSLFSGPYYTRKYGIIWRGLSLLSARPRRTGRVLIKPSGDPPNVPDLLSGPPPFDGVCFNLLSPDRLLRSMRTGRTRVNSPFDPGIASTTEFSTRFYVISLSNCLPCHRRSHFHRAPPIHFGPMHVTPFVTSDCHPHDARNYRNNYQMKGYSIRTSAAK